MYKKILLVVAGTGYQQTEYGVPKKILEDAGFVVHTASDIPKQATAKDGSMTLVDITLPKINADDYDGIFFIGGPGAINHLDNQESNRILNEIMILDRPYGAICIAPRILAKAHVLVGKKATGWNEDGKLEEIFRSNNVEYLSQAVVVDGNTVTASGPEAATEFGQAIITLLTTV